MRIKKTALYISAFTALFALGTTTASAAALSGGSGLGALSETGISAKMLSLAVILLLTFTAFVGFATTALRRYRMEYGLN